jgi:hypothetical protein
MSLPDLEQVRLFFYQTLCRAGAKVTVIVTRRWLSNPSWTGKWFPRDRGFKFIAHFVPGTRHAAFLALTAREAR